ncbi:MAG: hypothetical protein AB7O59_14015 [Pirellulales bacterium]
MRAHAKHIERALGKRLRAPHVLVYLLGVLILAGAVLGPDAALLMLLGIVVGAVALVLAVRFRTAGPPARFSLRALLILVTGACLFLGLVVNRLRDQRLAVARIESLGGRVSFGADEAGDDATLLNRVLWFVLGEKYMAPVQSIGLENAAVVDRDLVALKSFPQLKQLELDYTAIGDEGIAQLAALPQLYRLDVEDTEISDRALETIGLLPALSSLILDGTKVSDDGLQSLSGLPSLVHLRLRRAPITDAGLLHLARIAPLQSLDVTGTHVTGEGVATLQKSLPKCKIHWDDPGAQAGQ